MGKKYYCIEDQVNDCMELLRIKTKDAYDMDEEELEAAEFLLSAYFTWVEHPDFVQAVPKHKKTGALIIPSDDVDAEQTGSIPGDTDGAFHLLDHIKNYIDKDKNIHAALSARSRLVEMCDEVVDAARKDGGLKKLVLEPMANGLAERLNGDAKVYGPYGLRAEYSVFVTKKGSDDDILFGLTLTEAKDADGNTILLFDTGDKVYEATPESIAGLNGLDNATEPLPDTIDEIIECSRIRWSKS